MLGNVYEEKGRHIRSQNHSALTMCQCMGISRSVASQMKIYEECNTREELYDFTNERENIIG